MSKSRKEQLLSYEEYRLREAYDENGEWHEDEDDWSYEQPQTVASQPVAGAPKEYPPYMNEQSQDYSPYMNEPNDDQGNADLETLGMDARPRFAEMPDDAMKMAGADKPEPDEDPEDWQAKKDIEEIAGVYGLKLGSTKSGKLVLQGNRSQWRQDFPDYSSAKKWIESNMDKVMKK